MQNKSRFLKYLYTQFLKWNNLRYCFAGIKTDLRSYINIDKSSDIQYGHDVNINKSTIKVTGNSSLSVGSSCKLIQSSILIHDNCRVTIADNFRLLGANLVIRRSSEVSFRRNCLIEAIQPLSSNVQISKSKFIVGENGNIRCDITVKNARFKLGNNSFINQGSQVRCENLIEIGDYVFISYDVDIFDTNTHSIDWRVRRQEAIDGYPNHTKPTCTPDTAPIRIGDNVWVGKRAAILKGCDIGARSIIGTRAVVTSSCPPDSLMVGNPATIRQLERLANTSATI